MDGWNAETEICGGRLMIHDWILEKWSKKRYKGSCTLCDYQHVSIVRTCSKLRHRICEECWRHLHEMGLKF